MREVFRGAILAGAAAMVVSHNHPSGDPAPSSADIKITRQLCEAAKILDIQLLDHVIVGNKEADAQGQGWYSCRDAGLL
jgi:DNA repair protein RadC